MKQVTTERSKLVQAATIIGDFIIINMIFIVIYLIFHNFQFDSILRLSLQKYLTILNISYVLAISCFNVILHKRIVSPERIVRHVILTVTAFFILFVTILSLIQANNIPRSFLFSFYIVFLMLIIAWRLTMREIVKNDRKKGKNNREVAIIGSKSNVVELYHELSDDTSFGYHVIGVFEDEP